MTTVQILSLAIFAAILFLSVWLRINVGLVAFPAAFLLASIAHISAKETLSAFPGELVILIIGITLLFAHVQRSGAIDWLTNSALRLVGSRRWAIPWVGFVLASVLGTVGGLPAAVVAIVIPVVAGVARSYRINYFMMAIMANWAAIAAGMSPLSPAGALFRTLAQRAHLSYSPWTLYGVVMGIHAVAALIAFLALGGVRLGACGPAPGQPRPQPSGDTATGNANAADAPDQRATGVGAARREAFDDVRRAYRIASLVALVLLVIAAVGLRIDIGLSALSLALLLQVCFRPPEKEMLGRVAWSVVLLLAGLLIYLNLLEKIGTLQSIQNALHGIGSPIATMLALSYITALLSNVDSSTLVVLGAMAPIGLTISSGSAPAVLAVLVTVATATAIISMSPVHIDGSLIIANTPNNDEPLLFRRLIYLTAAISIVVPGIIAVYPIMAGA